LLLERDNGVYLFPHDLVREVALADLGATRRRILHRRVAQALEQGAEPAPAERLADHYLHSDTPERAIPFLGRAAEQARQVYAHNEAAGYYRALVERLDALGRTAEAARAREELGAVLRVMASYDEALAVLERALATYRAQADPNGMGRALAQLGWVYVGLGSPDEGITRLQPLFYHPEDQRLPPQDLATVGLALVALCKVGGRYLAMLAAAERAIIYAAAAGEPRLRARAEMERAIALMMLGRNREGFEALEAALPLVEAAGDPTTLAQTLNAHSVAHETRGGFDLAKHDLERAVAAAERGGDPTLLAYMINRQATNAFATGLWDQALLGYQHAAALMEQIGQSWVHSYPLTGLGRLELARGNTEVGAAHLRQALHIAGQMGDVQAILSIQAILAEPELLAGRFALVLERLDPLLEDRGQESDFSVVVLPLVWAYSAVGQTERAEALLAQALARMTADNNRLELINVRRAQAIVAAQRRDWATAEAAARESLTLSHDMGLIHSEIKARHTLAALLRDCGDTEQARQQLEIAQAQCQRLGERLYGEYVERLLRAIEPPERPSDAEPAPARSVVGYEAESR
jgi:tetratricopeptide (TPR) repeat protein